MDDEGAVDELGEDVAAQFVFRRHLGGEDALAGGGCGGVVELAHGDDGVAGDGGDAVYVADVGGGGRLNGGGKEGGREGFGVGFHLTTSLVLM